MDRLLKFIQHTLLEKGVICLAFVGLLTVSARAQGILPPVITPPIVLPSVLSSGGSVTNGGIAIITTTITTTTSLKANGTAWYCNGQLVPASKSVLTSVGNLVYLNTLTLSNVAAANAGSYTLRATNGTSQSTSSAAVVVVANLVNVVTTTVTNIATIVTGATGMTSTGFQIKISGLTGSNVVIQASSDLMTWTPISTNTFVSGLVNFIDTSAKSRSFRYYRTYSP